jgi:hypothetical protein
MITMFLLYLQSIRRCLEYQFDAVIKDRTTILQKLYLLDAALKDEDVLQWEFFLGRFDTLCIEAQLDLESSGDGSSGHVTGVCSSLVTRV